MGSVLAMDEAEHVLHRAVTHPAAPDLRRRLNELAEALDVQNYAGSEVNGLEWDDLEREMAERQAMFCGSARPQLSRVNHFAVKIWKKAGQLARGEGSDTGVTDIRSGATGNAADGKPYREW